MHTNVLRRFPSLRGATPELLDQLAQVVVERHCLPGEVVFREGSVGGAAYLIVEGAVEVVRGEGAQEVILARRGPGDLFGEMGLVEGSPRFATIRALEHTHLLQLSEQAMRALWAEQPEFLYQIVKMLSARLREADLLLIADLQRKNEELARAYHELQEAQAALVDRERLDRELELAREIQQSMLPSEFPRIPGVEFAARSQPAHHVGGDFYDVISLDAGRVGLVIGDVSDKGMPAALFMALTRSLIRAESQRSASPQQALLSAHRLLTEMNRSGMFVTVFFGVLDPTQGILRYARAGHDRPLCLNTATRRCQFLRARGMALGHTESVTLEEACIGLCPGDILVLYTDGITDAPGQDGTFFGLERLRETVCRAGDATAPALCELLWERVAAFQAGSAQYDDMALLVARMVS